MSINDFQMMQTLQRFSAMFIFRTPLPTRTFKDGKYNAIAEFNLSSRKCFSAYATLHKSALQTALAKIFESIFIFMFCSNQRQ